MPVNLAIHGHASFGGGQVVIHLAPAVAPPAAAVPVPRPDVLLTALVDGTLPMHPLRGVVGRQELTVAIINVQRRLNLRRGLVGEWSQEAGDQLKAWLMAAKRSRALPPHGLALPWLGALAAPCPPQLALHDASHIEEDGDQNGEGGQEGDHIEEDEDQSGEGGEEGDEDECGEEGAEEEEQEDDDEEEKEDGSDSSSSSNDSCLRQRIEFLEAENAELGAAVGNCQELETENKELRSLNRELVMENDLLRQQLDLNSAV